MNDDQEYLDRCAIAAMAALISESNDGSTIETSLDALCTDYEKEFDSYEQGISYCSYALAITMLAERNKRMSDLSKNKSSFRICEMNSLESI